MWKIIFSDFIPSRSIIIDSEIRNEIRFYKKKKLFISCNQQQKIYNGAHTATAFLLSDTIIFTIWNKKLKKKLFQVI